MKETGKAPPSNTQQSKDTSGSQGQFFSTEKQNSFFNTQGIQPKLAVGQKGDKYEQQADAMADKIVSKNQKPAPAIQTKGAESEEVERLDKKEEEPDLQTIHRKPIFESSQEPDGNVQKKENGTTSSEASPSIESRLHSTKGQGAPLDGKTLHEMESGFGSDLSGVRVHTNNDAQQMSSDLNAQAFTHGNDIYFNQGKYNPETASGKHLLAHELTHTIQQTGSVQKMIQMKPKDDSKIDTSTKEVKIKELRLPKLKERNKGKIPAALTRPKGYKRKDSYDAAEGTDTPQQKLWKDSVAPTITTKVEDLLKKTKEDNGYDGDTKMFYLAHGSLSLIGTKETIIEGSKIPGWNSSGKSSAFDVDHILELQLGGENKIDNMELLNFSANRASGSFIRAEIEYQYEMLRAKQQKEEPSKKLPVWDTVKESYEVKFLSRNFNHPFQKGVAAGDYWTLDQVKDGKHLKGFTAMSKKQIAAAKGTEEDPVVYTSEAGGKPIRKSTKIPGATLSDFSFPSNAKGEKSGSFTITVQPNSKHIKDFKMPVDVYRKEGVIWGGYIPRRKKGGNDLESVLSNMQVNGMSPLSVDEAGIVPDKGLVVRGRIHPTLEIVKGIDLDFFIEGDEFGISKTLTAGDIKVPPPFKINGAFLTIGAGNKGIFVAGDVFFEINKLGTGAIHGKGRSDGSFGIKGEFEFDKKLFKGNKASIEVEYDNVNGWAAKGELEIAKNSVKGVESGKITVNYAKGILEAEGMAKVKIKGVDDVRLRIKFGENISEIEGDVKISKLPGIKEGSGTLKIAKIGEEYDFSGKGKITPDIPGLDTSLAFEFHNDIFSVDAHVSYNKGRLKGTLNVGITNRAIDPEGKPTGEALPDYKVFGSSSLELKITDSLIVTAGVKLLENGEIEVKGGIKLPSKFQVVPVLLSIPNKPIITIPAIHIPLFGIPLGVATIGIEAVIEPKLEANVQIGPGSLMNVQAEVTYNPAHPDDLTVTGGADFEFIAEAGITAGVDFGLSASIAIASLTGGINLSAYIKAAAKQPVFHADIKYSPSTGFELNGNVQAMVKAILGFSGDFFVRASAGVWPLKISKTWKWPLFKKEVDTGLEIGFEFPFGYKNGKADISFDNLKFKYPTMSDITKKVREQIVDPLVDEF